LIFGLEPMHLFALPRLIAAVLVAALLTVLADPWAASSAVRNDVLMMPYHPLNGRRGAVVDSG
jgi:ABC-type transporter Mla maintaining outer membrane lipid asymmetry permease subunit MlaE